MQNGVNVFSWLMVTRAQSAKRFSKLEEGSAGLEIFLNIDRSLPKNSYGERYSSRNPWHPVLEERGGGTRGVQARNTGCELPANCCLPCQGVSEGAVGKDVHVANVFCGVEFLRGRIG